MTIPPNSSDSKSLMTLKRRFLKIAYLVYDCVTLPNKSDADPPENNRQSVTGLKVFCRPEQLLFSISAINMFPAIKDSCQHVNP